MLARPYINRSHIAEDSLCEWKKKTQKNNKYIKEYVEILMWIQT